MSEVPIRHVRELTQEERVSMNNSFVSSIDIGTTGITIVLRYPDDLSRQEIITIPVNKGNNGTRSPSDVHFPIDNDNPTLADARVGELPDSMSTKYITFRYYKKSVSNSNCQFNGNNLSTATNGETKFTEEILCACFYHILNRVREEAECIERKAIEEGNMNPRDYPAEGRVFSTVYHKVYFIILHPVVARREYFEVICKAIKNTYLFEGATDEIMGRYFKFLEEPVSAALLTLKEGLLAQIRANAYMLLVDSGGGTTDYAMVKLGNIDRNDIKAPIPPGGNDIGSTNINSEMIDLVAMLLTRGRYGPRIFDSHPEVMERLDRWIESEKVKANEYYQEGGMSDIKVDFDMIPSEIRMNIGFNRENLEDYVSMANSTYPRCKPWMVSINNNENSLFLRREFLHSIIADYASRIASDIQKYIAKCIIEYGVILSNVVLVGGFSNSKIFQDKIKNVVPRLASIDYSSLRGNTIVAMGGVYAPELGYQLYESTDDNS